MEEESEAERAARESRREAVVREQRPPESPTIPPAIATTMMSGSDPNTSIVPPTKSIDGATEVRENLERDPSLGRKRGDPVHAGLSGIELDCPCSRGRASWVQYTQLRR
jgi:hypothetical protein